MLTHNVFSVGKSVSYSEPYQTCQMKRFAKIFDDLNPLNISAKHFISEHDEKVLPCHDVILERLCFYSFRKSCLCFGEVGPVITVQLFSFIRWSLNWFILFWNDKKKRLTLIENGISAQGTLLWDFLINVK